MSPFRLPNSPVRKFSPPLRNRSRTIMAGTRLPPVLVAAVYTVILVVGIWHLIWLAKGGGGGCEGVGVKTQVGGTKDRVAMLMMSTEQTSYYQMSIANKQRYARKHGYELRFDAYVPPPHEDKAVWHRLTMMEEAVATGRYDWLWYMDFDTLITNHTISLTDIIHESIASSAHPTPSNIDFLFTSDCFPLNDGSALIRSHPRIVPFLKKVWACGFEDPSLSEQDCFARVLKLPKDMPTKGQKMPHMENAIMIPQWKINAFPPENRCTDNDDRVWEPGMFLVHFAGIWAQMEGVKDPYGVVMEKYREYADGE